MLSLLRTLILKIVLPFLSGAIGPALHRILTDTVLRTVVLNLIRTAAQAANLTPAQRKHWVLEQLRAFLAKEGFELSEAQLNLLVELVYNWLKHTHPSAIAPAPVSFVRKP
jgi:hypothetical protein